MNFNLWLSLAFYPGYRSETLLLSKRCPPSISVLNIVMTRCLLVLHSFLAHVLSNKKQVSLLGTFGNASPAFFFWRVNKQWLGFCRLVELINFVEIEHYILNDILCNEPTNETAVVEHCVLDKIRDLIRVLKWYLSHKRVKLRTWVYQNTRFSKALPKLSLSSGHSKQFYHIYVVVMSQRLG